MKLTTLSTLLLVTAISCAAQGFVNFSSGSTGADGPLDYSSTPSGTTVNFNPTNSTNIYNFTTINIPSGVTVRLSGRNLT